jgi:hypothetical protein
VHQKLLRESPFRLTLSAPVVLLIILLKIFPILLFSGIFFFAYWLLCSLLPCHFSYLNAAIVSTLPACCSFVELIIKTKKIKNSASFDDDCTDIFEHDEGDWEEDESDERARCVLGKDWKSVSDKSLAKYHEHLKNKITYPCMVTGIEEFEWETLYSMTSRRQKEYKELKKINPCASDKYHLLSLEDWEVDDGIIAKVKRVKDQKEFSLPLADLETLTSDSVNYQLLDDYSVWFMNSY